MVITKSLGPLLWGGATIVRLESRVLACSLPGVEDGCNPAIYKCSRDVVQEQSYYY